MTSYLIRRMLLIIPTVFLAITVRGPRPLEANIAA